MSMTRISASTNATLDPTNPTSKTWDLGESIQSNEIKNQIPVPVVHMLHTRPPDQGVAELNHLLPSEEVGQVVGEEEDRTAYSISPR